MNLSLQFTVLVNGTVGSDSEDPLFDFGLDLQQLKNVDYDLSMPKKSVSMMGVPKTIKMSVPEDNQL